jgi:hypothetical protein
VGQGGSYFRVVEMARGKRKIELYRPAAIRLTKSLSWTMKVNLRLSVLNPPKLLVRNYKNFLKKLFALLPQKDMTFHGETRRLSKAET